MPLSDLSFGTTLFCLPAFLRKTVIFCLPWNQFLFSITGSTLIVCFLAWAIMIYLLLNFSSSVFLACTEVRSSCLNAIFLLGFPLFFFPWIFLLMLIAFPLLTALCAASIKAENATVVSVQLNCLSVEPSLYTVQRLNVILRYTNWHCIAITVIWGWCRYLKI